MAGQPRGRRALQIAAVLLALAAVPAPRARAGPPAQEAPAEPPREDPTGIRVAETPNRALWIPRTLLFVPRMVFEAAVAPLRLGAWAWDRYRVPDVLEDFFFNDARTVGLYPLVSFSSVVGLEAGARFVHRDLFGRGERLSARARFGGRYDQGYRLDLGTGQRLRGVRLDAEVVFEVLSSEQFFGFGNRDLGPRGTPADPRQAAKHTRYRRETLRGGLRASVSPAARVEVTPWIAAAWERFGSTDRLDDAIVFIADAYDRKRLRGLDGYVRVEAGARLAWEDLRRAHPWIPAGAPSSGGRLAGHVALAAAPDRAGLAWPRYGAELEGFFDLYRGTRVLRLRTAVEGVGASLDAVPFAEVPSLGGPARLRGYERGRFHDRFVVVSTVEYRWLFNPRALAYLFVDAGRAFESPAAFTFRDYRVGFGGGVELMAASGVALRAQVASSPGGGVLFDLALDPGGAVARDPEEP